jgi:hypothetical protein
MRFPVNCVCEYPVQPHKVWFTLEMRPSGASVR